MGVLFCVLCMQILCVFCMVFSFMVTVNGVVVFQLTVGVSVFVDTVSRVNTVSSMGRIVSKSIFYSPLLSIIAMGWFMLLFR